MDILETIFTRRSIRKYTGEPVGEDELKLILKAGFYAPSAHNKQPWHFVVIRDPEKLQKISDGHKYSKMLPQAGCAVIVCGDRNIEELTGFLVENCSAAIENMLLAAHGIGLGAVWCGLYPVTKLTELVAGLLGLPSKIVPVGMVVIGHGAEAREVTDRYDESRIHLDQW